MCIRDSLSVDRGRGDLEFRQRHRDLLGLDGRSGTASPPVGKPEPGKREHDRHTCKTCLLYTSDAADERSSVDLGGRRIIKKKNNTQDHTGQHTKQILTYHIDET